jgi:GxxExxY protein
MQDIIRCIKNVNETLGNYYKENVYQAALCVELNLFGILFQSEVVLPIKYKGICIGYERADIVIYSKDGIPEYIIELKSQNTKLSLKEVNQLRKYIKNLSCNNGLLVNFFDDIEIIYVTDFAQSKIDT